MAYKTLTINGYYKGEKATVKISEEDYDLVSRWSWGFNHPNGYARRSYLGSDKKWHTMYMARQIMGYHDTLPEIDHINGDKLDNRRENLRFCTAKQNSRNRINTANPTGYVGVNKVRNKYRAALKRNGKRIHIGHYDTVEEAAKAVVDWKVKHNEIVVENNKSKPLTKYNYNYKRPRRAEV